MTLFEAERKITISNCIESKPIFATKQALGEANTLKVICFIIHSFQKALKLSNDKMMDSTEIVICASDFMDKYSYDSVTDLIFALKQARHDGKIFYNKFSQQDMFEILNRHFEDKAKQTVRENQLLNSNRGSIAAETLKVIEQAYTQGKELTEPLSVTLTRQKVLKQLERDESRQILSEADWQKIAIQQIERFDSQRDDQSNNNFLEP